MQNLGSGQLWFILISLWTLPWKGVALWKSARAQEKWWFIALLLINTIGILEIVYIFFFAPSTTQKKGFHWPWKK